MAGGREYVGDGHAWEAAGNDSAIDALEAAERPPDAGRSVRVAVANDCVNDTFEAEARDSVYTNALRAQASGNRRGL